MKVFYDDISNNVVIETLDRYFGTNALVAENLNGKVLIKNTMSNFNEVFDVYTNFQKEDGAPSGANITDTIAYLNTEFQKTNLKGTASFSLLSTTVTINNPRIKLGDMFVFTILGTSANELLLTQSVTDGVLIVKRSVISVVTGLTSGLNFSWAKK